MALFKFLSRKLCKLRAVILPYTMMANMTATINYGNALHTREMCGSGWTLTVAPLLKP